MFQPRSVWIHSAWMLLVTLVVLTGCGSDESNSPLNPNPPDEAPPLAPMGVGVLEQASSKYVIGWTENGEPDLAGYRVYLRDTTDPIGSYRCLTGTTPQRQSKFVFGGVVGRRYELRVTAVDRSGNESAWSETFELTFAPTTADQPCSGGRTEEVGHDQVPGGGGGRIEDEADHAPGRTL